DETRADLTDLAHATLVGQESIRQEGVVRQARRLRVVRIQILDPNVLIAVADEVAGERTRREAPDRVHPLGRLGELADVLDFLVEDVDAGGGRSIEEERLGETDLVVLRAVALLQRDAEGLAAAQEVRGL